MTELKNRIDFIYMFDVQDGNPNGDPDAGNLPRVDAETGMGLVTDVCLKRKVRNYVQVAKGLAKGYDIYIKEKAVLGQAHVCAFKSLGFPIGQGVKASIEEKVFNDLSTKTLPDGVSVEQTENNYALLLAGDIDKDDVSNWLKNGDLSSDSKRALKNAMKNAKPHSASSTEREQGREWMCTNFFDIRTFGAVLSLKSAPNCGQVRGPIQITFARSIDPIFAAEHSITRVAVATESEAKKQRGENHTMGRKATVPYGLYVCHGFISANLAKQTGFSEEDLNLFFEALKNMFDLDRSAARGLMSAQKLIIFRHKSELGNAPANKLFDLVKVEKATDGVPRSFADYRVSIDRASLPENVKVEELI